MQKRIAASLSLVSLLLACGGSHSSTIDPGLRFPPTSEVDRMIQSRVEAGFTEAIVVGLLEADGTRRIHAYGNAGDGIPLDGGTLFEIGSITKVFASTVLAQMVHEGLLALDDPVQAYLPDGVTVPSRPGQVIRFVDIATHRSGLPTMPPNRNPGADYPAQRLYDFLSDYELPRDVGAEAQYSNVAVALMGHALALKETEATSSPWCGVASSILCV